MSKTSWQRATGGAFVVIVLGIWLWIETRPVERLAPPPGAAMSIDKSDAAQKERKAHIDRLLGDGFLRRIDEGRGSVRAVLRQPFYDLERVAQRDHLEIVYRYYFDGTNVNDEVVLRDARNGNKVGEYNPYKEGLKIYK